MNYLVEMKLANSSRPATPEDGVAFIEQFILPTLELGKKLEAQGKILAGGPMSGTIALALIVNVETVQELDELVSGFPVWPRMETTITPLTSFDGRAQSVRKRLEQIRAQARSGDSGSRS